MTHDINHNLKFIKSMTWEEVFESWEEGEADLEHWIEHYKKRGFHSWKDWRSNSIKDLNLEKMSWKLYEITDPLKNVPLFHGGPFRAWIKNIYQGSETPMFSKIVNNHEIKSSIEINQILKNFPKNNVLVGLATKEGVVIIDGMHRCCAIALAAQRNQNLETEIFIAIANFPEDKVPLLGNANSPT